MKYTPKQILMFIVRVVPAIIMLQTLAFKFSGHEQAIDLFTRLGAEPFGRYATGVFELIAGVGLLIPKTYWYAAILTIGLMLGALGSHVAILGFEGPDAQLGIMAVIALVCAIYVVAKPCCEKCEK
jgi:putative oxidoreductase